MSLKYVNSAHNPYSSDLVDCIVRWGPSDGPDPSHAWSSSNFSILHPNAPLFCSTDASDPAASLSLLMSEAASSLASATVPGGLLPFAVKKFQTWLRFSIAIIKTTGAV